MQYYVQGIEESTGFPFSQYVSDEDQAKELRASLESDGYVSVGYEECWSNLDEMYEVLAEDEAEDEAVRIRFERMKRHIHSCDPSTF